MEDILGQEALEKAHQYYARLLTRLKQAINEDADLDIDKWLSAN
jgi:hypothetical protein